MLLSKAFRSAAMFSSTIYSTIYNKMEAPFEKIYTPANALWLEANHAVKLYYQISH